jgi:diguanylate cyclase (GGDEF)-like protein
MHTEESRFAYLPRVTEAAALIAAVIGALALLGWIADVDSLAALMPEGPRMKANTAIAMIGLAAAVWLIRKPVSTEVQRASSIALAELVVLLAALTLAEYILSTDLGIDGLFTDDSGDLHPGRMSPHAAVAFVFLGLWLILLDRRESVWTLTVNVLAALSGLVVLAALIAFLYGADYVYGDADVAGVSPQTSVGLVALFVAILCSRPESPGMRLLLSPGSGGHTIRRLMPALIAVPIIAGGALIAGVDHDLFSTEVGVAFAVAGLIAVLLAIVFFTTREVEQADAERRELQARMVELADRDPLTDVFNRRRLDDELGRQVARIRRNGSPLAVLSIDLDGFKATNDTHGHATGDELLIATAQVLREELRAADFVSRPGGDEFIVLLPDSDEEAATNVAGKLVHAFHGVRRPRPDGGEVELRASVGIAVTNGEPRTNARELLAVADRALYSAKQAGGDRFVLATEPALG